MLTVLSEALTAPNPLESKTHPVIVAWVREMPAAPPGLFRKVELEIVVRPASTITTAAGSLAMNVLSVMLVDGPEDCQMAPAVCPAVLPTNVQPAIVPPPLMAPPKLDARFASNVVLVTVQVEKVEG